MRKLFVLMMLIAGCASGSIMQASERQVAVLVVTNDWQERITVYTAHDGQQARRLGEVEMKSSAHFLLQDSDFPGEQLQVFVLDRLSGLHIYSDVVQGTARTGWKLSFGPLPNQAFLFPVR